MFRQQGLLNGRHVDCNKYVVQPSLGQRDCRAGINTSLTCTAMSLPFSVSRMVSIITSPHRISVWKRRLAPSTGSKIPVAVLGFPVPCPAMHAESKLVRSVPRGSPRRGPSKKMLPRFCVGFYVITGSSRRYFFMSVDVSRRY